MTKGETFKVNLSMIDPKNQGSMLIRKFDDWILKTPRKRIEIESSLEEKSWEELIFSNICSPCSYFHNLAYVQAVETGIGIEIPPLIKLTRVFFAETSRVLNHLWHSALTCQNAGSLLYHQFFKARRLLQENISLLTGELQLPYNTIGGLLYDFSAASGLSFIREVIESLEEKTVFWISSLPEQRAMNRLEDIEIITSKECRQYNTTGPLAKVCGISSDFRTKDDPNGLYFLFEGFEPVIFDSEMVTAYDSFVIRLEEILDSFKLMKGALKAIETGSWQKVAVKIPSFDSYQGEMVSRVESHSGVLLHYFLADGNSAPLNYRYITPSMLNFASMVHCLESRPATHATIIIHCFDLCLNCGS
ncbi:MAG: NADH-quinone oxidoreductase subunit D-related protein [Candidatus Hodarchaeales archaeon]